MSGAEQLEPMLQLDLTTQCLGLRRHEQGATPGCPGPTGALRPERHLQQSLLCTLRQRLQRLGLHLEVA